MVFPGQLIREATHPFGRQKIFSSERVHTSPASTTCLPHWGQPTILAAPD